MYLHINPFGQAIFNKTLLKTKTLYMGDTCGETYCPPWEMSATSLCVIEGVINTLSAVNLVSRMSKRYGEINTVDFLHSWRSDFNEFENKLWRTLDCVAHSWLSCYDQNILYFLWVTWPLVSTYTYTIHIVWDWMEMS